MNMLVAIESPISAVASLRRLDEVAGLGAGAPPRSRACSVLAGKARSGWRVNSPVMVSCVLTMACEAPGSQPGQRIGAGADHQVAAQQQVGAAGAQPHGVQRLGRGADADMADHRAALLRHAELVEHGGALAFDMRGHAHDGADGDDAGAADAGDQHAVGLVGDRRQGGRGGSGGSAVAAVVGLPALPFLSAAAFDGDEARAEAVQAGEVLVAGRLVDGALGAELGLDRRDAKAVRLRPSSRRSPRRPPG